MITEEQIDRIVERLTSRIEEANIEYLKAIGESIKQIREIRPTEAQKLIQILKYGGNYKEIRKKIAKYTDLNIKDIDKIFEEYAKQDQSFYEKYYRYRNIPYVPYEENIALQKQTQAIANMVKNEMYNFTRSNVLGYTIRDNRGNLIFRGLKETYNDALDKAFLNVGQGKETFDTAMKGILADIGGSGLKTIEYESGRTMRLDSAVRMHLKGRLRELHNENQKMIGEEIKADGVEISVHSFSAPDHEPVQGHQFSNEEYAKLDSGLEAKDYKGRTYTLDHDGKNGYRPISEMNCYHYIFAIILGVDEPVYTDEELQQKIEENKKGFEYEGKHYTKYQGTQIQRMLERRIRKEKDIQILAKESGNKELMAESQKKITELRAKYKEFSDVSELRTKAKRMSVAGYKKEAIDLKKYYEENLIGLKNEKYEIKGVANHIIERKWERNMHLQDLVKDFTNPLDYDKIVYDKNKRPSVKIIGENVTVYINPETGVITTWHPTHKKTANKYGKRL